jgi:endoglucanase
MKRLYSAVLFFSTVFNLSSQELLKNSDFDSGGLSYWKGVAPSGSSVTADSHTWGVDIFFDLSGGGGGTESWEVQLFQTGVAVRPGYTYTISFGGSGYYASKSVLVGIGKDGDSVTGDGSKEYPSYVEKTFALSRNTYTEHKSCIVWNDTDITDSKARFFFNGGGDDASFTIAWASVYESKTSGGDSSNLVAEVNLLGYYSNGQKIAVIRNDSVGTYEVRNSQGVVKWSGTSVASGIWPPSNENVQTIDFTSLTAAGTYAIYFNDNKISSDFTISATPYATLGAAAIKAFYYQRASTALTSTNAGSWSRNAGHPDNTVYVHSSAGSGTISSPKGWYDAGDYGKYIVNSGITTYTLLLLYEHFPEYMKSLPLNIPESGNSVPDILDEIRWNLDWMLTMQASDGGVYHKLTPLKFDGFIMPDKCTAARYAFMKTTSASLNFAAVMAKASRLYAEYDQTFALKCLNAAKEAFAWAKANPSVYYSQPAACETGEYGDKNVSDERFWAATELTAATDSSYDSYFQSFPTIVTPVWINTGCLGLFTILTNKSMFSSAVYNKAQSLLTSLADTLLNNQSSGYKVSMTNSDFIWGSNSVAANQGLVLLHAFYVSKENKYLNAAVSQLDYLLGRNPLGICYVTGQGSYSPLHPHHRISDADGVTAPVPGLLVGGPHMGGDDIGTDNCVTNYIDKPATSYLDSVCSFATNEIAINWNAPLAYLSNALEAIFSGEKVHFGETVNSVVPVLIPQPEETKERSPTFRWHKLSGALNYQIAIDTVSGFTNPVIISTTAETLYTPSVSLNAGNIFWRVKSNLNSSWSVTDTFKIIDQKTNTIESAVKNNIMSINRFGNGDGLKFIITLPESKNSAAVLSIFDIKGRIIYCKHLSQKGRAQNTIFLNNKSFGKGVFITQLVQGNTHIIQRFILK